MSADSIKSKKKAFIKMISMGIISIALYIALLLEQDIITNYFTKGGLYAMLPLASAFVFSFAHGSFTSNFWRALGIRAARKKAEVK